MFHGCPFISLPCAAPTPKRRAQTCRAEGPTTRNDANDQQAVSALGEAVVLLRLDAAQRPTVRGIERKLDRLAERRMNDTSRRPPLPALLRTWRGTLRSYRAGAWPLGREQSAMRLHA